MPRGYTGCMEDALGTWGNKAGVWGGGFHGMLEGYTRCI